MAPRKIIVDTDTGIDDAAALFMALEEQKQGRVEILAIMAVCGNGHIPDVKVNILRVLDAAGFPDIPVHLGSGEASIIKYPNEPYFHGSDGFNDVKFDWHPDVSRVKEEGAVRALHRLFHKYPGEIDLVMLGPLTNLALAFKVHPELPTLIHEIFIMGGNTEGIGNSSIAAEFNFHADPEAVHVVLEKVQCPTYLAPWELCLKYTKVSMDWRLNVLGKVDTPQSRMLDRAEKVWFDKDGGSYESNYVMCDQIAMAICMNKKVIKESSGQLATVELTGQHTRGQMILEQRVKKKARDDFKHNVIIVHCLDEDLLKKYMLRAWGHKNVIIP